MKDYKTLSVTHKDMDFISQKKLTIEKVAAVMGVPKNILGYTDNVNLANGKELRKEYIEGTINPLQEDFEFILNSLMAKFKPEFATRYIIRALGETLEERDLIEKNQREDLI